MPAPKGNKFGKNGGRPTAYKKTYNKQVEKLCKLGAVDKEIADFFEISESAFNEWKKKYQELRESIKRGKLIADANISDRLYQRALGYEHNDTEVFCSRGQIVTAKVKKYYPPDTTAAIFWLKNRRKNEWRDKQEHELTGKDGGPIETTQTVVILPSNGHETK